MEIQIEKTPGTPKEALEPEQNTELLVKKAQRGDERAFEMLVETYERFVYHTALRVLQAGGGNPEEAEDVAQSAFLKAWRSLRSFRGECSFSSWLYRITINCGRDHCRIRARHPTVSLTAMVPEDGGEEELTLDVPVTEGDQVPEDAIERKETIRLVRKAIGELPEDMRQVIYLREIEELSYADIASLLGLEVGTVKSRLSRARSVLKEALAPLL